MKRIGWFVAVSGCVAVPTADTPVVQPLRLTVVSFNTGTTEAQARDEGFDGYGQEQAGFSDTWYGDGLAWMPAIRATRAWFDRVRPDVVAFQEIFDVVTCADIPEPARVGFVCETWQPGDLSVPEQVLGPGYQVGCFPGHGDKCVAVRRAALSWVGCDEDRCDDLLLGEAVDGCGRGARVARGEATLVDGSVVQLVGVHGTSGASADDQACRVAQVEQVRTAVSLPGQQSLVLGDLNTDPGRLAAVDASAQAWAGLAGAEGPLHWVTPVGVDTPATYSGLVSIDHVAATDGLVGEGCAAHGVSEGTVDVYAGVYFDHHPVVCQVVASTQGDSGAAP